MARQWSVKTGQLTHRASPANGRGVERSTPKDTKTPEGSQPGAREYYNTPEKAGGETHKARMDSALSRSWSSVVRFRMPDEA